MCIYILSVYIYIISVLYIMYQAFDGGFGHVVDLFDADFV